jgi:hypothetical protein
MWFKKMIYVVRRSISSVKKLKRIERKETKAEAVRLSSIRPSSANNNLLSEDFVSDWDKLYNHVPFDLSILADFGFVDKTP